MTHVEIGVTNPGKVSRNCRFSRNSPANGVVCIEMRQRVASVVLEPLNSRQQNRFCKSRVDAELFARPVLLLLFNLLSSSI